MKRLRFFLLSAGLVFFVTLAWILGRTFWLQPRPKLFGMLPEIKLSDAALSNRLAEAVRFKTIAYENRAAIDGKEFLGFHAFLEKNFPKVFQSLPHETLSKYTLLFFWRGTEPNLKPIVLSAHQDVVPIEEGSLPLWSHPPFNGDKADGFIWGRGTMDDKQNLLGILEAVEWLLSQKYQPRRSLWLAFGHDEEIGGDEGAFQIAQKFRREKVIPEFVLDEGGYITDGILKDVPKPVALIGIAEKGYLSAHLTVEDAGGHSAAPPPHTTIGVLSAGVEKLENHPMPRSLAGPLRQMLLTLAPWMPVSKRIALANLWLFEPLVVNQLKQSPAVDAALHTTTAATVFRAGEKDNVLPLKAEAVVNFRLLPGDTVSSVLAHIEKTLDDPRIKVTPTREVREPSPVASLSHPAYSLLERTIQALDSSVEVAPYLFIGGTDSMHYDDLTPNVYRFFPLKMTDKDVARIHGIDERISIRDYVNSVRFFIQFIQGTSQKAWDEIKVSEVTPVADESGQKTRLEE